MRVVLAYNAKPSARSNIRSERPQFVVEEEAEPPPTVPGAAEDDDRYAEWDDHETIIAVADALASKYEVRLVEAGPRFAQGILAARPDLVFNMSEGLEGVSREALVPAILELLGVPYTGSDPLTLALCLDKAWTKVMLTHHGVPNAPFFLVEEGAQPHIPENFPLPALVKPVHEGSSKGVKDDQLVRTRAEMEDRIRRVARDYHQGVIVEGFLPGREFTVAVLGNGAKLRILPPVEILFGVFPEGANPIYSWEAKWIWDRPENPLEIFKCPADLNPSDLAAIQKVCADTVRVLRIRDWARVDLRMDANGVPNVIEINPLPGILPRPEMNSCFPKAARATGMQYQDLILAVADAARERLGL
jgi:D-alanine-D-alanine ligase